MNAQLDFIPRPAPYQSHSDTSREAADKVDCATGRTLVLRCLRGFEPLGLTDEQMQTALGMNPSTQRPRRIELVRMGLAYDTGMVRETQSGRMATIWRAVNTTQQPL